MKKAITNIITYILALALLTSVSPALAAGGGFWDVAADAWYATYVEALTKSGAAEGYADGSFRPDAPVKLGEAAKLLSVAVGAGAQKPTSAHWASGYIKLAAKLGSVKEDADPEASVTRLLAARLAADIAGLVPSAKESPFADCDDEYAAVLYECGVVDGVSDGEFYPEGTLTRAQLAAMIYRLTTNDIHKGKLQYGSYWVDELENVPLSTYSKESFPLKGIDVSYYQGDIDWQAVKADGVDFAMLRLGYRGYGAGGLNLDSEFLDNRAGAASAGVPVGVYFFSQAVTVEEAVEEADFVLRYLAGRELSYPVCFDWEPIMNDTARTDGLARRTLTDCAVAFCDKIAAAGYEPMIYFTSYMGYTLYDLSRLTAYDFWFAQYSAAPTFRYDFDMWQYSSKGQVAGIEGNVDMNYARTARPISG